MGNSSSELQPSASEVRFKSARVIPSQPPPTPQPPPPPTPPPSPPPKTLMDKPWRKLPNYGKELENKVKTDIMKLEIVDKAKVLLFGHVNAGKSSFINSCLSVGEGRKSIIVATGSHTGSLTTKFQEYDNLLLKGVTIADCMGIETDDRAGFNEYDFVTLLQGHIKEGYTFKPDVPIKEKDPFYIGKPKYTDRVHCVVFVLSARAVYDGLPLNITKQIKRVQEDVLDEGISRILVLTKADLLCEDVQEDVSNIYRSKKVQTAVQKAHEILNIPKGCIHPVVNFEDDITLSTEKNIPILLALRQIMENAHDRVKKDHKKGIDNH